jgi:hypothetical protein
MSASWFGTLMLASVTSGMAMTPADGMSSQPVPSSWQTVQFQGISVAVPSSWPVYDLRREARCVRSDLHAAYLGHQTTETRCPARLVGKSEAVHLEPLDGSVAAASSFATQVNVVNGQRVRLDPAADVTHNIVVAIDQAQVLLTISFATDRQLATQVLYSLTALASGSRSDARPVATALSVQAMVANQPLILAGAPGSVAAAVAGGNGLPGGSTLSPGQFIQSPSARYTLIMQTDGNLVLYDQGYPLWASSTWGNPGAHADMQSDGNLVVYSAPPTKPLWASGTWGNPGAALSMQNDGNAVIYTNQGQPLWATNTVNSSLLPGQSLSAGRSMVSPSGEFTLPMQVDGNLVLYHAGEVLWASNTWGNPGAFATMQSDGNLVVYTAAPSRPLWATGTWGNPGATLFIQNDGNLVIYMDGRPLWASNTNIFRGLGFDTCAAPSTSAMNAWLASPFRAVGIYIGGANRACPDGNLSASWVSQVSAQGWSLIPIYVGLQAPCKTGFVPIDPNSASSQGLQAADDAIVRARGFGIPVGSPIFFDMEGYSPTGGPCSSTVMTFLSAWAQELRAHGIKAGVYSSLDSGIMDLINTPSAQPDEIWFAKWDGNATTSDPAIPANLWPSGHRLKQYLGGQNQTYGGVTINIDQDYLDALLR